MNTVSCKTEKKKHQTTLSQLIFLNTNYCINVLHTPCFVLFNCNEKPLRLISNSMKHLGTQLKIGIHIPLPTVHTKYAINYMFPLQLISFPSERCGDHTSCDQCIDQVDPVCGWCALDNKYLLQLMTSCSLCNHRCSTNDSCSSSLWISSNGVSSSDQCPIGSITNNITISTEQLSYDVSE